RTRSQKRLGMLVGRARTPADRACARHPDRLGQLRRDTGSSKRTQSDDVSQLSHSLYVAKLHDPRQPQGIESVSRQQAEIFLGRANHARGVVMQEVSLIDRLYEQFIVRGATVHSRS